MNFTSHRDYNMSVIPPLADYDRVLQGLISPAELERGLTDSFVEVRAVFAMFSQNLTTDQIERGLTDKSDDVRLIFLKKYDLELTKKQIDRALNDENYVIESFLTSTERILTKAQICRGLKSKDPFVRCAFINRHEFIPTTAQASLGIKLAGSEDDEFFLEDENEAWKNAIARGLISDFSSALPIKKRRAL